MKILVDKMFGSGSISPPEVVLESFGKEFSNYASAEWTSRKEDWEVVFYLDNSENIALFDPSGNLKEHKKTITTTQIPTTATKKVRELGEVMNVIKVLSGQTETYEIIYRDKTMTRHLVLLDQNGIIIQHKKL